MTAFQAFSAVRFLLQYVIPCVIFVYCYGRIFHVIKRQTKVFTVHVAPATTSRGPNTAVQVQQPATERAAAAAGVNKLSRTELNVIQTMIAVIVCFIACFSVFSIANFLLLFGVSRRNVTIFRQGNRT